MGVPPPPAAGSLSLSAEPPRPASGPHDGASGVWQPGNVIDELYEVQAVLGKGGFGSVHKVYHRGWGFELAVKSPRPDRVANRRAMEHFVQEANTWVGLGLHPHIVTCYFVRVMDVPRIFIEYVEGKTLTEWLVGRQRSLPEALDIALQIARAESELKAGKCESAADVLAKARQVKGFERAPAALELGARLGLRGLRRGLASAWRARALEGHKGAVLAACFTPDGKQAISGGADGTVISV